MSAANHSCALPVLLSAAGRSLALLVLLATADRRWCSWLLLGCVWCRPQLVAAGHRCRGWAQLRAAGRCWSCWPQRDACGLLVLIGNSRLQLCAAGAAACSWSQLAAGLCCWPQLAVVRRFCSCWAQLATAGQLAAAGRWWCCWPASRSWPLPVPCAADQVAVAGQLAGVGWSWSHLGAADTAGRNCLQRSPRVPLVAVGLCMWCYRPQLTPPLMIWRC